MNRFDYVEYGSIAQLSQKKIKDEIIKLELLIEQNVKCSRSKSLAMEKLEEVYMWIGKGIRNDQIDRDEKFPLQEQRTNS